MPLPLWSARTSGCFTATWYPRDAIHALRGESVARQLRGRHLDHNVGMPEFLGAVLWDLDGTLVDSEEYHWRAWKETLDREGISITRQDFLSSFGCIVVEDAQAGVEAARRAEMRSIGVGRNAGSLGADIAVAKLSDLPCDVFSSLLRI